MPKNKGKGGKNRRKGKGDGTSTKRELVLKEEGQEYAQVTKMLGNGRMDIQCFDGTKRQCHIPGRLRKKVWIAQGDIILVGLRDFQDAKCDVIQKYTSDEARELKARKEIPETTKINENTVEAEEDDIDVGIEFGDESTAEVTGTLDDL